MLRKSKYRKKHVAVFDFICTNIKKHLKCERKTIILSHKRKCGLSTILNIAETVKNYTSQNGEWVKILQKPVTVFDLIRANREKYLKWDGKTFTLPQKREYGLLSDLKCSRYCWENTQARMLQRL